MRKFQNVHETFFRLAVEKVLSLVEKNITDEEKVNNGGISNIVSNAIRLCI